MRLRPIAVDPELIETPCSDAAKWTYIALCCADLPKDRSIDAVTLHIAKKRGLPVDHIMSHLIELVDAGLIQRLGDFFILPDMPANELRTFALG